MPEATTLRTERLLLRPSGAGDAAPLFPILSDAAAKRWWPTGPFASAEALATWLAALDVASAWTICQQETVIGQVLLRDRRPGVAELEYGLAADHWGRGLGRESLSAVIAHGFGAGRLRRIYTDNDPANAAGIGTMAALGFTLEGRLREARETVHGVRDSLIFGLLAREWTARGA